MNCQQFTSFIVEAARGRMMEAASREGALRHAESCQACAARLAQEQSLTGALRAVALGMKDLGAPARVEANLLAAFHESRARLDAPAPTDAAAHAPVSLSAARAGRATLEASRRARRVASTATVAIAASLVLVVLATLYLRFTQTAPPPAQDLLTNNRQAAGNTASNGGESALAAPSPLAPSGEPALMSAQQSQRVTQGRSQIAVSQRAAAKDARRQRVPTMIKAHHVIDGGNAIIEPAAETAAAGAAAKSNEAESVTDFISLVADAPAGMPLESGQLVRVQVPRAALASLGLPLNAERGNEPVKADVLLGGDGLARAIRFVR